MVSAQKFLRQDVEELITIRAIAIIKLLFQLLKKKPALIILNWQYPYPYNCYNFNADTIEEDLRYLLDVKNNFFAILNQQEELE